MDTHNLKEIVEKQNKHINVLEAHIDHLYSLFEDLVTLAATKELAADNSVLISTQKLYDGLNTNRTNLTRGKP